MKHRKKSETDFKENLVLLDKLCYIIAPMANLHVMKIHPF